MKTGTLATISGKQQLAVRCGGVHLLSEAAEGNTKRSQVGDDGEQVRQRAPEPVQPSDSKHVTLPEIIKAGF